jgi:S-adenosyl-L-methionine hydrolase (adenosine-forming)
LQVKFPKEREKMPIVTLTSDFGEKDWYVAALKGAILKAAPAVQLVDISHQIEPFDIVQAALVLKNSWMEFPDETIHLLAVNCVYSSQPRFVAVRHGGHYFFAPDNGLLTLLLGDISIESIRHLDDSTAPPHFAVKHIFALGLGQLISNNDFEKLGTVSQELLLRRILLRPVINAQQIRGTVVHIDHFENVVLNIERELFDDARKNRNFSLYFKRNDPIVSLSYNYSDVPMGETLCLFNSIGLLEIAVNFGKAATLLGLKKEDVVELVFEE